jgi:hypothetical protein
VERFRHASPIRRRARVIACALVVANVVPRIAQAQGGAGSASLDVTARIMPSCQLRQVSGPAVRRWTPTSAVVVMVVEAESNTRHHIVAQSLAPPTRDTSATPSIEVRDVRGAFVALEPGQPVLVIAPHGAHPPRRKEIVYRVSGALASPAAATMATNAAVVCVLDDARVANGVVLGL